MADETKQELARRAVNAAKRSGLNTERLECCERGYGIESGPWKGELLALVREAWGSPGMSSGRGMDRDGAIIWGVLGHNGSGLAVATGDSEAEALVAALEAAP